MAGIYGPITEHPEYPINDDRRFSVTIKAHAFVEEDTATRVKRVSSYQEPRCNECGFEKKASFHGLFVNKR